MLTTFDDDDYVTSALRKGAVGYLLKNIPPEDLLESIRSIKRGSVLISPEVASRLVDQLQRFRGALGERAVEQAAGSRDARDADRQPVPRWVGLLTRREREILELLAQGFHNRQIAEQLHVAEQTVKNNVSVIYSKLDVHDRLDIIRLAGGAKVDLGSP
jgi:DNA-binding NarL/FixJ family response regulator